MNFGIFFTMVPMWVLVHPRPTTTQTSKKLKKKKLKNCLEIVLFSILCDSIISDFNKDCNIATKI